MMSANKPDLEGFVQIPVTSLPSYSQHTTANSHSRREIAASPHAAAIAANANAILSAENGLWMDGTEQLNPLSVSTSPLSASILGLGGSPDSQFYGNQATAAANLYRAQVQSHASAFPPQSGMHAPPSYSAHVSAPRQQNGNIAPSGLPTYSAHMTGGGIGRGGNNYALHPGAVGASTPGQSSASYYAASSARLSNLAQDLIKDAKLGDRTSKRGREESDDEAPTPTLKLTRLRSILAIGNDSPYITGLGNQTPAELKALAGTPRGMSIPFDFDNSPAGAVATAAAAAAAALASAERAHISNPGSAAAKKARVAARAAAVAASAAQHAVDSAYAAGAGGDGPPPASPIGRQPPPLQGIVDDLKSPGSPTMMMKSPSQPGSGGSTSSSSGTPSSPLLDAVEVKHRELQDQMAAASPIFLQPKKMMPTPKNHGVNAYAAAPPGAPPMANHLSSAAIIKAEKARGNYKCGTCGFAPKRRPHDCIEVNRQRIEAATAAAALQAANEAKGFNVKPPLASTVGNSLDGEKKRGGYKCGVCGFFPKKTVHDCEAVKVARKKEHDLQKRKLAEAGIDPHASKDEFGRGAYKCGDCGFFPKKAEHDCEVERKKIKEEPLSKRGSYKCGDCGFKPKKTPHDCEAIRKAAGMPPLNRNIKHENHADHPTAAIAAMATMAHAVGSTKAILKDGAHLCGHGFSPTALPKPN